MAKYPALPLWTDAYLGDTTHLTTIEHGAYLLLLMAMWRSPNGSLPNDDRLLARYAKLTKGQWSRIRPVLDPFFRVRDGQLTQGRLTDEREAVRQHSQSQSNKAKSRWLKDKESPDAAAMPEGCPHTHTHIDADAACARTREDAPPTSPDRDPADPIYDRLRSASGVDRIDDPSKAYRVAQEWSNDRLAMRVSIWRKRGATDDEIVAEVASRTPANRGRPPPTTPTYFDPIIDDFVRLKSEAAASANITPLTTPSTTKGQTHDRPAPRFPTAAEREGDRTRARLHRRLAAVGGDGG